MGTALPSYLRTALYPRWRELVRLTHDPRWGLKAARAVILLAGVAFGTAQLVRLRVRHPGLDLANLLLLVYAAVALAAAFMSARARLFHDTSLVHYLTAPVPFRHLVLGKWLEVLLDQFDLRYAFPALLLVVSGALETPFHPAELAFRLVSVLVVAMAQSTLGTLLALWMVRLSPRLAQIASALSPWLMVAAAAWLSGLTFSTPAAFPPPAAVLVSLQMVVGLLALLLLWLGADSLYRSAFRQLNLHPLEAQRRVPTWRWRVYRRLTPWFVSPESRVVIVKDFRMLESNVTTWIRAAVWASFVLLPLIEPLRVRLLTLGPPRAALAWGLAAWAVCFSELAAAAFTAEKGRSALYKVSPAGKSQIVLGKVWSNLLPQGLGTAVAVTAAGIALDCRWPELAISTLAALIVTTCATLWISGFCSAFGSTPEASGEGANTLVDQVTEQAVLSLPSLLAVASGLAVAALAGLKLLDRGMRPDPWVSAAVLFLGVGGLLLTRVRAGFSWLGERR